MSSVILLVSLIEQVNKGEIIDRSNWPLHVTLVPWLKTENFIKLHSTLKHQLTSLMPVKIRVGPNELFGPNRDIKVNTIEYNEKLMTLHKGLLGLGLEYGKLIDDSYVLENYIAHITHSKDRWRTEGELIVLNNITIIRLINNKTCEVVASYGL
jgi:hypothetical protein